MADDVTLPVAEPAPDDELPEITGAWCAECHGLGGWELSGDEVDFGPPEDVECPCCGGAGEHVEGPCPATGEERPPNG